MQPEQRSHRHWERIFGRLHRISTIAEQFAANIRMPLPFIPEEPPRRIDPRMTSHGTDVAGNRNSVGPTDPEVYAARRPTPPLVHIYEMPKQNVPDTMTPTSQLIRDLFDEFGQEEACGVDTVGSSSQPTYANDTPPMSVKKDDSGYVDMTAGRARNNAEAANEATAGSRHPVPNEEAQSATTSANSSVILPTPEESPASPSPENEQPSEGPPEPDQVPPTNIYDILPPSRPREHRPSEYARRPIPQGSPPLPLPRDVPVPTYYRDYFHYEVMAAYHLICHSCWYVQLDDIMVICAECATAEHTFCINDRPNLTWRQFHLISRNFMHTTMHCGRCYRLLIKTRRAIDCYTCRIYVINHSQSIERLTYRLLCDRTIQFPSP